jgi:uracil-DNA glycosylase
LAPGAHGSNRTGRMFTGDGSGETLSAALYRVGLANKPASVSRDDGLVLTKTYLTAVARCAPPGNRPLPEELNNCRPYLARELDLFSGVRVVLTLGRLAFDGYLRLLRERGVAVPRLIPRHGELYQLDSALPVLAFSYHPSRQNTQTGRLTGQMLDQVFQRVGLLL